MRIKIASLAMTLLFTLYSARYMHIIYSIPWPELTSASVFRGSNGILSHDVCRLTDWLHCCFLLVLQFFVVNSRLFYNYIFVLYHKNWLNVSIYKINIVFCNFGKFLTVINFGIHIVDSIYIFLGLIFVLSNIPKY